MVSVKMAANFESPAEKKGSLSCPNIGAGIAPHWLYLGHFPVPEPSTVAKDRWYSDWLGLSHMPSPVTGVSLAPLSEREGRLTP